MTTLPQTSSNGGRLAAPRSNGHPALPGPHGPPPGGGFPGQPAGGASMTLGDVLRVLRTNLWLIAGALILSAAAGYGVNRYLAQHHPRYTARGLVQIRQSEIMDPLGQAALMRGERNTLSVEQQTQTQILQSDALWTEALQQQPDLRETAWFMSFARPSPAGGKPQPDTAAAKLDLAANFSVSPVPESTLIRVSMSSRDPESARVVLTELVDAHIRKQQSSRQSETYERTKLVEASRQALQQEVSNLESRVTNMQGRLGETDKLNTGFGTKGIKESEIGQFIRERGAAELALESAKANFDSLRQQVAQGLTPATAEAIADQDPRVQRYQTELDDVDLAIQMQLDNYRPDHPVIRQLERRRELVQSKLDERLTEKRIAARTQLLEGAESEQRSAQARLDKINEQIAGARDELNALTADLVTLLYDQEQLATKRALVERLSNAIETINNNQNRPDHLGGVQWADQPKTPDSRSFPQLRTTMGAALVLGLGLSLGLAFLREVLDTSVRSPRDIARVGQMTLLGMIPHEDDDPQAHGVPLPRVIARAPQSIVAEQFRQVRTRLQQAANLDTVRTILVTSPGPGDGKTIVACNLAAGLALNGRRILLVDANFRRPSLHEAMAVANDVGLSTVLASSGAFESSVQPSDVPNLDVLPCGPRPSNPTELLESQAFHDFIDRALEEYDHLIFDSGPMLFVSETVALAPRVDGVITVVRAKANSRGLLGRLRDSLRQLKAEHLGVVLNAVRAQAGGYYNRNIKTYYAYQNGAR